MKSRKLSFSWFHSTKSIIPSFQNSNHSTWRLSTGWGEAHRFLKIFHTRLLEFPFAEKEYIFVYSGTAG